MRLVRQALFLVLAVALFGLLLTGYALVGAVWLIDRVMG